MWHQRVHSSRPVFNGEIAMLQAIAAELQEEAAVYGALHCNPHNRA